VTLVTAAIEIDAPRERVYDAVLDPEHLDEWVTIHRRVLHRDDGPPRKGFEMEQTLVLRHTPFTVRWTLTEADRPDRATWEGRGPAHSYARTSYRLRGGNGGPTRFEYENEFKVPGGFLGAAASRVIVGGVPQREANRSLQRLKALIEDGRLAVN
jgi:uncharacterized protein YndB with AHSA1/START domain